MQQHETYDRDNDVRRDIESALAAFGYVVEAWNLADKPADDERTLTIKAVRNLRVEQQSLGLVQ